MVRACMVICLATFVWGAFPLHAAAQVRYDKKWSYNKGKDYYYKKCSFPKGGYQYIIFYQAKPEFIYWYNPVTEVCWCCCPTVKNPVYGDAVKKGKDLFLMADKKAKDPKDAKFPDANDANFKKGAAKAKAKDKDGSEVDLSCPPPDLP